MSEIKSCPFCGGNMEPRDSLEAFYRHPRNDDCPLSYQVFKRDEWNTRDNSELATTQAALKLAGGALNESKISILDLIRYFDAYDTTRVALLNNMKVIESALSHPAMKQVRGEVK